MGSYKILSTIFMPSGGNDQRKFSLSRSLSAKVYLHLTKRKVSFDLCCYSIYDHYITFSKKLSGTDVAFAFDFSQCKRTLNVPLSYNTVDTTTSHKLQIHKWNFEWVILQ